MSDTIVLVVEDDPSSLHSIVNVVEGGGYYTLAAKDATSALELVRNTIPTIIIQDLALPDLNGAEVVRCIRRMHGYENVPVIYLSACVERIESTRLQNEPNSRYIIKPIEPDQLMRVIKEMLA